ncbi:MAG: hypothetical protein IIV43_03090 [Oscillospiraceae bacterium]|nr:hypothetical protein [Oscillospiraceae bacterium]
MNKKKLLAMCLIVCLLAVAAVNGTLAYFTDTDSAKNVMAVGNIAIEQNEQQLDANGALEPFVQSKKLFPMVDNRAEGDSLYVNGYFNGKMANVVDKIITVSNKGSEAAYVRTILAFETQRHYAEGSSTEFTDLHDTYFGVLGNDVEYLDRYITVDGVEYVLAVRLYEEALAPAATTEPSLKQFFLAPTAGNEVSALFGNEYTILALSQAVQTAGFEDTNDNGTAADEALNKAFGDLETMDLAEIAAWFAE